MATKPPRDPFEVRRAFWRHVTITSGCWLWTDHTIAGGYGRFQSNHRRVLAHRFAWETAGGPVPDGMDVLHKCDTPACVNPAHLFLGTHQQNMADRDTKGRGARGSRIGSAKLTEQDVSAIRAAHTGRYGQVREMARQYGVSSRSIHAVLSNEFWRDCGEAPTA